ncbi:hypothetical protein K458DRAFT_401081 [Lentithecium fluviatile CBS 122367]|uniref:Uncharacterized protein n=1 Tax=Lentithecium fluviatile CBS 122367 TaxID=1168545 RepID=A0A6G1JEK2_9PLEO|nr:hypothetical protein K458DRAFT_401081 [Lentithecium fluviatile CBS 122367]
MSTTTPPYPLTSERRNNSPTPQDNRLRESIPNSLKPQREDDEADNANTSSDFATRSEGCDLQREEQSKFVKRNSSPPQPASSIPSPRVRAQRAAQRSRSSSPLLPPLVPSSPQTITYGAETDMVPMSTGVSTGIFPEFEEVINALGVGAAAAHPVSPDSADMPPNHVAQYNDSVPNNLFDDDSNWSALSQPGADLRTPSPPAGNDCDGGSSSYGGRPSETSSSMPSTGDGATQTPSSSMSPDSHNAESSSQENSSSSSNSGSEEVFHQGVRDYVDWRATSKKQIHEDHLYASPKQAKMVQVFQGNRPMLAILLSKKLGSKIQKSVENRHKYDRASAIAHRRLKNLAAQRVAAEAKREEYEEFTQSLISNPDQLLEEGGQAQLQQLVSEVAEAKTFLKGCQEEDLKHQQNCEDAWEHWLGRMEEINAINENILLECGSFFYDDDDSSDESDSDGSNTDDWDNNGSENARPNNNGFKGGGFGNDDMDDNDVGDNADRRDEGFSDRYDDDDIAQNEEAGDRGAGVNSASARPSPTPDQKRDELMSRMKQAQLNLRNAQHYHDMHCNGYDKMLQHWFYSKGVHQHMYQVITQQDVDNSETNFVWQYFKAGRRLFEELEQAEKVYEEAVADARANNVEEISGRVMVMGMDPAPMSADPLPAKDFRDSRHGYRVQRWIDVLPEDVPPGEEVPHLHPIVDDNRPIETEEDHADHPRYAIRTEVDLLNYIARALREANASVSDAGPNNLDSDEDSDHSADEVLGIWQTQNEREGLLINSAETSHPNGALGNGVNPISNDPPIPTDAATPNVGPANTPATPRSDSPLLNDFGEAIDPSARSFLVPLPSLPFNRKRSYDFEEDEEDERVKRFKTVCPHDSMSQVGLIVQLPNNHREEIDQLATSRNPPGY